ncbi:hypothetical protein NEOLEDRAFT_1173354 [Neolentinus lepideus HHB14362 ss-1]|uniref:Amino acid permease/ SLC12A domain-containing protein n=1 Tax=Neolentinus lepideus HHB14362 ss-1 TaxID=1314782 RepID=A0A165MVX1_9AGAM|nr:hypothetical protein NEOLEDRAFT_1173354 [Neolentinus lepideus HHB14362 ss-1]
MEINAEAGRQSCGSFVHPGLEKGRSVVDVHVAEVLEHGRFDAHGSNHIQRKLDQRHVQMIAIAGTIGTGLFLGSGHALQEAGPAGSLIGYALAGTVAYSSLCAVGEMTSLAPISGTFTHFASRWVDSAFGFAVGWNYFYTQLVSVCLIYGLILAGLIIDLGRGQNHERAGFRYWRNPGAFVRAGLVTSPHTDKFLGFLSVIVQAAFSFQGMELIAIAASETRSLRRNIAKAVRRVFYRILEFYILGILITGMIVPYNDPELLTNTNNAAQCPYVIVIRHAGIRTLPSIINAAIFTSALSAANSDIFSSSRILYGLVLRGQAPRVFTRCTKAGLPIVAVLTCSAFSFLSFMNVSNGSALLFIWFVNLSTVGGFFGWWGINLTYTFFYRGLKAQGQDRKKLVYFSSLQPWLSH